jgi:hypothetical protein
MISFFVVILYNIGFGGFLVSVKQCFFGMLGDFDVDNYAGTTFQYVSASILVIYVVVVSILLLNLLIAMMGDTYGNVIEGATQIWLVQFIYFLTMIYSFKQASGKGTYCICN